MKNQSNLTPEQLAAIELKQRTEQRAKQLAEIKAQIEKTTGDDRLIASLSLRSFILEFEQLLDAHPTVGGMFIIASRETGEGTNIVLNVTPREMGFGLCNVILSDVRLMTMLAIAQDMLGAALDNLVGGDKLRQLAIGANGLRHAAVAEGLKSN